MISLFVQAVLGLGSVGLIIASNRRIFRRPPVGPLLSATECIYYAAGLGSVAFAWYFRAKFATEHSAGSGNPLWGPGSWADYIRSLFANSAASSVAFDYILAKVVVLPLLVAVEGFRHGVRRPLLFFFASFFTSFTFALAFYLATRERQRRLASSFRSVSTPPQLGT